MANTETILCDVHGCNNVYAYRQYGFNLCAKHLNDDIVLLGDVDNLEALRKKPATKVDFSSVERRIMAAMKEGKCT